MKHVLIPSVALLGLTTICALPAGARPPEDLAGSWRGAFWQVNAGNTGYVHGDVELEVSADGTYRETLITRQVAGSSRTKRTHSLGSVAVNSNGTRIVFTDWRRTTLRDNGDVLHGVLIEPSSGQTIAMRLEKVPDGQ
jgi:hypothetical protein